MLLGPLLGGWLATKSFRLCYACSAVCGVASVMVYTLGLRETLNTDVPAAPLDRAAFLKALNPLGFMRLLRSGRKLACLTMA